MNGSPHVSAATAACCDATGAQVTIASWTFRMSAARSRAACKKPTRHPVIPYALENETTRTTRSRPPATCAGLNGRTSV